MASPPEFLEKNPELKLRSNNNIVNAPANTGKLKINKKTVIKTDQIYKFKEFIFIITLRIIKTVVIKLILPKIEDTPAK